jgi:hypothetical protein
MQANDISSDFCKIVAAKSVTCSKKMKRISKWFERADSQQSEFPSQIDRHEPETSELTPIQCATDLSATLSVLTSLDASFFEVAESDGFDPYNSGSFVSSKSGTSK